MSSTAQSLVNHCLHQGVPSSPHCHRVWQARHWAWLLTRQRVTKPTTNHICWPTPLGHALVAHLVWALTQDSLKALLREWIMACTFKCLAFCQLQMIASSNYTSFQTTVFWGLPVLSCSEDALGCTIVDSCYTSVTTMFGHCMLLSQKLPIGRRCFVGGCRKHTKLTPNKPITCNKNPTKRTQSVLKEAPRSSRPHQPFIHNFSSNGLAFAQLVCHCCTFLFELLQLPFGHFSVQLARFASGAIRTDFWEV